LLGAVASDSTDHRGEPLPVTPASQPAGAAPVVSWSKDRVAARVAVVVVIKPAVTSVVRVRSDVLMIRLPLLAISRPLSRPAVLSVSSATILPVAEELHN